jgi:hypothetical protein
VQNLLTCPHAEDVAGDGPFVLLRPSTVVGYSPSAGIRREGICPAAAATRTVFFDRGNAFGLTGIVSARRYCLATRSTSASIEELLAHARWLTRLARQLVLDRDLADDVAQDAWISATRSPPQAGQPLGLRLVQHQRRIR